MRFPVKRENSKFFSITFSENLIKMIGAFRKNNRKKLNEMKKKENTDLKEKLGKLS